MATLAYHLINQPQVLVYEAPFKTKCHQCFQNLYRTSNIYIGRPISISDIQYIYRTSNTYIRCPIYSTRLWLGQGLGLRLGQGYRTSDRYRTSDIYIGRPIYILDVRYRFRKHWWHFVLNGASYLYHMNKI